MKRTIGTILALPIFIPLVIIALIAISLFWIIVHILNFVGIIDGLDILLTLTKDLLGGKVPASKKSR